MKYKGIGTRAGHKLFVRNRETAFDKTIVAKSNSISTLKADKEMKTYEFAALQKKLFKEKAKARKRKKIILIITIVIVLLIFALIPYIFNYIIDPSYQSVKFQN